MLEFYEPLCEPLENEELKELLKDRENPHNKEKLILHNLKLVYWHSKRFSPTTSLDMEDLIQEGVIGLIGAIDSFDRDKGSWGNHASIHIKANIIRAISQKSTAIRIPENQREKILEYKKIKRQLTNKLGKDPTNKEIAKVLGVGEKEVERLKYLLNDPISLNLNTSEDDEDLTLEDAIKDEGPTPDELVEEKIFNRDFRNFLKETLEGDQLEIVLKYYGFTDEEYTMPELNKEYETAGPNYARSEHNKALRALRRTAHDMEKQIKQETENHIDRHTIFIRSVDYSQPKVMGGKQQSPIENIVLRREIMRQTLNSRRKKGGGV